MGKITKLFDLSQLKNFADFGRFTDQICKDITQQVNGNITFADNLRASLVDVYFGSTGSINVEHGLNVPPIGFFASQLNVPAIIYNGATTNIFGATFASLRSNLVGVSAVITFFS